MLAEGEGLLVARRDGHRAAGKPLEAGFHGREALERMKGDRARPGPFRFLERRQTGGAGHVEDHLPVADRARADQLRNHPGDGLVRNRDGHELAPGGRFVRVQDRHTGEEGHAIGLAQPRRRRARSREAAARDAAPRAVAG